jgi:NAD+ dependent glucose-6-phosphate dehydrogenase
MRRTKQKVLVTGMSGLIGNAVRERLDGCNKLTALNRRCVPGIPTTRADISDMEAIRPAFDGQQVVVHLAGYRGVEWDETLRTNIIGLYNVFEASRLAGVKRIIYASSGATVSGWQTMEPLKSIVEGRYSEVPIPWPMLTHETPIRPWSIYGAAKVWGEALARHYSEMYGMSVLCLRFAVVNEEDRPTSAQMAPVWCSRRDAAQMVERCIVAPKHLKFDIFNVVSNNQWGFRDLSHAREVVGYEPMDSAECFPTPASTEPEN